MTNGRRAIAGRLFFRRGSDGGLLHSGEEVAMNARTYWQKLRSIGWLKYVPEAEHDELRTQLEKNLQKKDAWDAHAALAQVAFEDDPVEDVLKELAEASRGIFHPTKVKAIHGEDFVELSFTHGSKPYSARIPNIVDQDRVEGVMELANQALAENDADQLFLILPGTPDFVCGVLVPPDVFAKAQAGGLIPSKFRVDFCVLDPSEADKVARLKKIPDRVEHQYFWDMTMEQLLELLRLMNGGTKATLRAILKDPSTRSC
jgi:hypothetical protein